MIIDRSKLKNTQVLLRKISRRLSGRVDCKGKEYDLCIGVPPRYSYEDSHKYTNRIIFDPSTFVYKDTHHRKDTDLQDIVNHIFTRYFPEYMLGTDDSGNLLLNTDMFVCGNYKYQLSRNGKRRWIRYI